MCQGQGKMTSMTLMSTLVACVTTSFPSLDTFWRWQNMNPTTCLSTVSQEMLHRADRCYPKWNSLYKGNIIYYSWTRVQESLNWVVLLLYGFCRSQVLDVLCCLWVSWKKEKVSRSDDQCQDVRPLSWSILSKTSM